MTEGTRTDPIRAHSLTANLWWLLPPAAALFYPQAVRALYESGRLLHRTNGPREPIAWLAIVISAGLIYSVPTVGIGVAYLLGSCGTPQRRAVISIGQFRRPPARF